ncbi:MAG: hypothetical protein ACHQRM_15530 [Bacteroidia bacterium]
MNVKVVTESPPAFVILCLLAGLGYSMLLYFREKQFTDTPLWLRRLMAVLRFVSITCIAFLLLNPLLKTTFREVEKPVVVIAQDNSESILIGKDSAFYRSEYKKNLSKLTEALSARFDVRLYTFGEKLTELKNTDQELISYKEKETDLSSFLDEMESRYSNRNLGALIIASDGLYNKGSNPVFSNTRLKAPYYTIALGDTGIRKDIAITKILHNRLAYLGNKFPVEIVIDAKKCKGSVPELTVMKGENVLFSQKIPVSSDAFNITVPLQIEAKESGIQHYRARISGISGELSAINNVQDFYVQVLDSREKILILCDAPHPDVAAIKQALENNQNYEVDAYPLKDFDKKVSGYNLVILHQIPSQNNNSKVLTEILASDVPLLVIVGTQTNIRNFNSLQLGLQINGQGQRYNEPQPALEEHFPLFTLSEATRKYIPKLPALACPFGSYKAGTSCFPLFYQEIGIVRTKDPLMLFNQVGNKKAGIIAGEGIWRWRLQDYEDHGSHDIFNELIDKTVQYLSVKLDKSQFRIVCKNNFTENQQVEMEAEVYNESYELVNEPEVNLEIENSEGHKYPYAFSKTGNAYRLKAGMFPPGEYKYKAHTKLGDKVMNQNGAFTISALVLEASNTTADHQLLYNLAHKHNGEMADPRNLGELATKILSRDDIRPVVYNPKKLLDLIELKWIFFLLLLLLGLEWMMRKRNGGY